MKPQNPYVSEAAEEGREDAGRPIVADPHAAERAMESDHQAFTGAATGVGSVGFEEAGTHSIGGETESAGEEPGAD